MLCGHWYLRFPSPSSLLFSSGIDIYLHSLFVVFCLFASFVSIRFRLILSSFAIFEDLVLGCLSAALDKGAGIQYDVRSGLGSWIYFREERRLVKIADVCRACWRLGVGFVCLSLAFDAGFWVVGDILEGDILWLWHCGFVMIGLVVAIRSGVFRSSCDGIGGLWRSPGLVLLIWLFSDGIDVSLNLPCGVDLHRTKYQLSAKAGSTAARGEDHLGYGVAGYYLTIHPCLNPVSPFICGFLAH